MDVCILGLLEILYKTQDGIDRVKFKFLALKWVITEQFHEYLFGSTFVGYTDNNPLT